MSDIEGRGVAFRGTTMKFGDYLESNLIPEWKFYYVDYNGLKLMLKGRVDTTSNDTSNEFHERDEAHFVEALENEMQKVHTDITYKKCK